MIGDYFGLASKNLKHRGIRSWLTLLGIFIGVAAVVSLISLGDGLKMAVSSQFGVENKEVITVEAGGISGAGPPGAGASEPLREKNVDAIERVSGVDFAFGRIISYSQLEFNKRLSIAPSMSVPIGERKKQSYEVTDIQPILGRLLKDSDSNKVVLGYNFYNDEAIFGKKVVVGSKVLLFGKEFEVVGITEKKGSFIFDNLVMVNENSLRELLNYSDKVDVISAKVKDAEMIDQVKTDIEKAMRVERDVKVGEENFAVSTPDATMATINQVITGVQIFVGIIAGISIFVGAIGIVNTMTTSVLERKREIGIMKAIGAKNSQIFMQFLIESGLLGLVGGLFGVVIGLGLGYMGIAGLNVFLGSDIIMSMNFYFIFIVLFLSFFIGSLAGVVPAMTAATQDPVEALRG